MTNSISVETAEQHARRMEWWREARFGLFIHWDISSLAGTEIGWSRGGSKPLDITGHPAGFVEDPHYDNLYKKFNPQKFDAKEWVRLAQAAGMKYIVFTAKHHGGFCMWDTKQTDYSIRHTPFQRDVVKELAAACHAAGLRFGIYYSQRDWHHPDYGVGDNQKYLAYMNAQLKELLTDYGKVDVIWWDSYGKGDLVNFWKIGETFVLVKALQPDIVMNNRLAVLAHYNRQPTPYLGDFDTPEQQLGKYQDTRPWESCMTVVRVKDGGGWSYRSDGVVCPLTDCLRMLISCATGDGNLLLDVGPDSTGVIPADQAGRLVEIGKWLATNGESIYGTRGGPWKPGQGIGSTRKGNVAYVHILEAKGDTIVLPALPHKIISASMLGGGAIKNEVADGKFILHLPEKRDPQAIVIKSKLAGSAMDIPAITWAME